MTSTHRQVGGQLGAYILTTNPTTQQLQALLGDLLADDKLLLPMRDLVARQCFNSLRKFAGSGKGTVERDVCLQELASIYLPEVVGQMKELINGMLDNDRSRNKSGTNIIEADPEKDIVSIPSRSRHLLRPNARENQKQMASKNGSNNQDQGNSKAASGKELNKYKRHRTPATPSQNAVPIVGWIALAGVALAMRILTHTGEIGTLIRGLGNYCMEENTALEKIAMSIPSYKTVNGNMYFTEANGSVVTPWKAAEEERVGSRWKRVYYVLSGIIHTTPVEYTSLQQHFIDRAEKYTRQCLYKG